MDKNLIVTPTTGMSSTDWHNYRNRGIGASEAATIIGLNDYMPPIQYFYKKLDPHPPIDIMNFAKFRGKELEAVIASWWEYWGGTPQSLIDNWEKGIQVRKCRKINGYIQNPDYPWLFASLDRIINKNNIALEGKPFYDSEGILEIKTISSFVQSKWTHGIPPQYLMQCLVQMIVSRLPYGELAILTDTKEMNVWQFDYNNNRETAEMIIERTKSFWDNVLLARQMQTQIYEARNNFNMGKVAKLEADIINLEPPLVGTEIEELYLSEKFKKSIDRNGGKRGTPEQLKDAVILKGIKAQVKELEQKARLIENSLKHAIGDGVSLDFGYNGTVSWQGSPKRFSNKIKNYENEQN